MLTLDQKGRITVPARWREQLLATTGATLVITKNADGGLALYPPPAWQQLESVVLSLTGNDGAWRRIYAGNSEEVEIDSASRVLIPPDLRRWAGLEREVKFMGLGSYFELWDLARYEVHEAQVMAKGQPEALLNLRLV